MIVVVESFQPQLELPLQDSLYVEALEVLVLCLEELFLVVELEVEELVVVLVELMVEQLVLLLVVRVEQQVVLVLVQVEMLFDQLRVEMLIELELHQQE